MPRAKYSYVTEGECGWFKLASYSGLRAAKLTEWVPVIEDRVRLQALLVANESVLFNTLLARLQDAPLRPLGFSQRSTRQPHRTDTASVQSLTYHQISTLAEIAIQRQGRAQDLFDGSAPADCSDGLASFAHIRLNLRATDVQIKADFAKWLRVWREQSGTVTERTYQKTVRGWYSNQLVPYFDLQLFAAAAGKRVTPKILQGLLRLREDDYSDRLRTLQASVRAVFNEATVQALRLAAAADPI